ncbi:MAG TPA: patatin-like phospholipase family protein [Firmicutes bacterium]|nr:patatin-like phospholipase family protein [Bacillota bacterium]
MRPKTSIHLLTLLLILLAISTMYQPAFGETPTIALVLGGGAARGFSHIGVIKALEDSGIPIDMLVGTSMGSIVAGLYAGGYSTENMVQIMALMDKSQLFEISIPPRGGILNTDKLFIFLNELLEGQTFSETPIPFYSVITELRTGEDVALHEGLVGRGIQASMSIPGMFPPVRINERYYVDGGIKNPVPVDVARMQGADIVIGVDVKKDLEEVSYDNIIHNLQLTLWFMTDGYAQMRVDAADVIITPDVQYDSYMEYQRDQHFIQEGYKAGLRAVPEIKAVILAKYPDFAFIPYTQAGCSSDVLVERIKTAAAKAVDTLMPFTLKPILQLEFGTHYRPGLGVTLSGGLLKYNQISYIYRYPMPGEKPTHEFLSAYARPSFGRMELYTRYGDSIAQQWGLRFKRAFGRDAGLTLSLSTDSGGKWDAGMAAHKTWDGKRWRFSTALSLNVEKLGDDYTTTAGISPEVSWYWTEDPATVGEIVLTHPYTYAGMKQNVFVTDHMETAAEYYAGLGLDFQLFGLYPFEVRGGLAWHTVKQEYSWHILFDLHKVGLSPL